MRCENFLKVNHLTHQMERTGNNNHFMKRIYRILITFGILTLSQSLHAQDASIIVEVSTDSLLMDNELELSYTIENAELRDWEPPDFTDFELIAGPSSSTMMQIINGTISRQTTYTYLLFPKKAGKTTIKGGVATTSDGSRMEASEIKVRVYPNPTGVKQNIESKGSNQMDIFSNPRSRKNQEPPKPKRKTYKI